MAMTANASYARGNPEANGTGDGFTALFPESATKTLPLPSTATP